MIRRRLKGEVVSDRMQKTVVVNVTRLRKHPKYLKYYKVSRRFKAHDENNEYKVGNKVMIEETRPLSKDKRWRVVGLIQMRSKTIPILSRTLDKVGADTSSAEGGSPPEADAPLEHASGGESTKFVA